MEIDKSSLEQWQNTLCSVSQLIEGYYSDGTPKSEWDAETEYKLHLIQKEIDILLK